jgi:hypothetical protein
MCARAHNGEITAAKTTTAPVVDGADTGGTEYLGAATINILAPVPAVIKLKTFHDIGTGQERIYILATVTDASNNNTDDQFRVFLDMFHDGGSSTADDIGFVITRGGQMNRLTGDAHMPLTDVNWTPMMAGTVQKAVVSGPASWTAEMMIQASAPDLPVAFLPSVMGLSIYVKDTPLGGFPAEDFWPAPPMGGDPFSPSTWADLKTRYPIEYMLVLDQSGSMLSLNRWVSAKNAANILANTLVALRDPGFVDKIGLITFKSDCFTDADTTTMPNGLAAVPSSFPGGYVSAPDPLPVNCTPIGNGLNKAFSNSALQVVSNPSKQAERVVLLLSDGFHNSPSAQVPLLPSHLLGADPCPATPSWNPCPPSTVRSVQVNTVAVGSDASVDTSLLTNIKNRFAGQIFPSTYNIAGDPEALKQFFIDSLDDIYQVNSIPLNGGTNEFTLNTGERKLVVILSWSNPAQAQSITLQSKPNAMGAFATVACSTQDMENTVVGYSLCALNSPPAGIYRALVGGISPSSQFNLVDLNLAATFSIDQQLHGTGEDIVLRARLNEAGVAVTNDPVNHPVKVTVSIRRPTEGFGTYVSTHEPNDCATAAPPKLPPSNLKEISPGVTLFGVPPLMTTAGNEPKPSRFAKIDELFGKCNKNDLNGTDDPGVELFDDGTHGDATPNDGVYTLRFQNTQFEGSYIFRFKAQGKSPAGSDFTRAKAISEYVRVEVDPASSPIGSRDIQQVGSVVTREYYVTPRDRFGGYLGPGHSDLVTFNTTAGTFISPVNDYNNGIYSRVLRFDRATENPVVTGTVEGKPLKPAKGYGGQKGFEFFPYLGGFFFQNSQGLDNGPIVGARFGYRFPNQIALEGETGVTFSKISAGVNRGRDVRLVQALGNVRYDIEQWGVGNLTPYVIVGAGGIFARSNVGNDQTFTVHGGFGSILKLTNNVGFRADARVFHIGRLYNAQSGTAFQLNVGLNFRF